MKKKIICNSISLLLINFSLIFHFWKLSTNKIQKNSSKPKIDRENEKIFFRRRGETPPTKFATPSRCLPCCFYSGGISEPVAKQIRAFVGGARTTRSNTEAQGAQWTFAERKEGERKRGRERETDTMYPLRSSAASILVHAKNLQPRQWRPRERNTTGTSCILAPIKRAEGNWPTGDWNITARSNMYGCMVKFMPTFLRIYARVFNRTNADRW